MQHYWMIQWCIQWPTRGRYSGCNTWQIQELIDEENDGESDITVGDQ